jgi:hypothetical protein
MSSDAGQAVPDGSDYSYDLVHEEVGAAEPSPSTTEGARAPEHLPEADVGDLSYDLAHEVPPAEPPD